MSRDAVPEVPLDEVEAAVQRSLASGHEFELNLLGQGQITLVIGWPSENPTVACKRLPPFASNAAAGDYRSDLNRYVRVLGEKGLSVVPSEFHTVEQQTRNRSTRSTGPVGYVIQPALDRADLAPNVLRSTDPDPEHPLLNRIVDSIDATLDSATGLDAQLANWAISDGHLQYMDVTTPMCFDEAGRIRLDLRLFLAAYPWMLRGFLNWFVAPGLVNGYTDRREVLVDLCANLYKDRLDDWVPIAMGIANGRGVTPVITAEELIGYYRRNARVWDVMLRLRYTDRWWQNVIRKRVYPSLLPRLNDR